MKFKEFGVLLVVVTVFGINTTVNKALAQVKPSIQFGEAIGAGGCNIADKIIGSDGRTLSVVLNNMLAENGGRKRCILRVETVIPNRFYVQDVQFLYQGSTEVSARSKGASLSRSYIFSGIGIIKPRPATTKFTSSETLFQVEDSFTIGSTSCGGQGQLGINIIAQSSPGTSINVDEDVAIHFKLAPCP